jgi:hypothetical protein
MAGTFPKPCRGGLNGPVNSSIILEWKCNSSTVQPTLRGSVGVDGGPPPATSGHVTLDAHVSRQTGG